MLKQDSNHLCGLNALQQEGRSQKTQANRRGKNKLPDRESQRRVAPHSLARPRPLELPLQLAESTTIKDKRERGGRTMRRRTVPSESSLHLSLFRSLTLELSSARDRVRGHPCSTSASISGFWTVSCPQIRATSLNEI